MIGSLADNLSVAIENAELHQEREQQAVTDGLTGVANRRSFNETFTREFERARRYGETLSLVMIDLDFLKKILQLAMVARNFVYYCPIPKSIWLSS